MNDHPVIYIEDGKIVVSPAYGYREPQYEIFVRDEDNDDDPRRL